MKAEVRDQMSEIRPFPAEREHDSLAIQNFQSKFVVIGNVRVFCEIVCEVSFGTVDPKRARNLNALPRSEFRLFE